MQRDLAARVEPQKRQKRSEILRDDVLLVAFDVDVGDRRLFAGAVVQSQIPMPVAAERHQPVKLEAHALAFLAPAKARKRWMRLADAADGV